MFFMRHGQSTFNAAFDTSGRDPQMPDAPLSPLGIKQVEKAAAQLDAKKIQKIISSPYTRALHTASIVAEAVRLPVVVEPLVGERRLYSCDIGRPVAQLKKEWAHVDFGAMEDQAEWWMPFHESAESLARRIRAFQDEWNWRQEAEKTLVVSHWYFISTLTGGNPENAEIIRV